MQHGSNKAIDEPYRITAPVILRDAAMITRDT